MAALIHAAFSVDRLIVQGQRALVSTVRATQTSQLLVESITAQERNARQYQVVGDPALLEVYQENHQNFLQATNRLATLKLSRIPVERLESLKAIEIEVHQILTSTGHDSAEAARAIDLFAGLSDNAKKLFEDNRTLIEREAIQLEEKGATVQRSLLVQAVLLVPVALILAVIFSVLITGPLRQLDRAIRRLGGGDFSRPTHLVGPQDLEQLGQRLDWMRRRLLEVEQEKNRFLRHISHELKTPLTAVREGAELINEGAVGSLNAQQREIASILKDASIELQKLIEDLLDFNLASSSASKLKLASAQLDEIIESVIADHRVAILARELDLKLDLQPLSMSADRGKIRTLVDNLLSNAIKFSPQSGFLRISLTRDQKANAIIEVEDSGPGIADSERDRIFETFYQGSAASRGHVRGTGLGLSIAREYVHAHNGRIGVVNTQQKGACFRVVLPGADKQNA